METKYNDDSIDMLVGSERIRRRPASMLGDNGIEGARHGITELVGNALDEASSGYGDKLEITYYKDGSVSLRDYGRGVPLGWNEERASYNWHIIYNELYGGGKYDNGQWYLQSVGKWSSWETDDSQFKRAIYKDLGYDVESLPETGEEVDCKDITLKREEGKYKVKVNNTTWSAASWKFLNDRLNYLASVGLNGLGASSTQYTSEYFKVRSYRDKKCTSMDFERGLPIVNGEPLNLFLEKGSHKEYSPTVTPSKEKNGTFVHWKADNTVFTDVELGSKWLYETCRDIAYVAGIDLKYVDENTGKEINLEKGTIVTLIEERYKKQLKRPELSEEELDERYKELGKEELEPHEMKGKATIIQGKKFDHGEIKVEGRDFEWVCRVEVGLGLVESNVENACYHNSVKMKSGSQYEGVDQALDKFFAKISKEKNIKLVGEDYKRYFVAGVSSYSNYASFRNQTKDAVQDLFIKEIVSKTLQEMLVTEYGKGNDELLDTVDKVIEKANERIQLKELSKLSKEISKVKNLAKPEKFVTCKAYEKKNYDKTELWITEGDSAGNAVKSARDKDFQAIFPIRGKGLNVLKASLDKILTNEEIKNIFALLGTGYDLNLEEGNPFDKSKLKFNKIIFATDADDDGSQIRVLLYLIFYKLAPELLRGGHVYIAETPRFEIKLKNGEEYYALDDRGRDELQKKYKDKIVKINRFKGLGEVNPDVLRKTTVAPESRVLVRLGCNMESKDECKLIESLFGNDKDKKRKQILTTVLGGQIADSLDSTAKRLAQIEEEEFEEEVKYTEV